MKSEVPKIALATDVRLSRQIPDCDVPSSDKAYIGRVASNAQIRAGSFPQTEPSINEQNSAVFKKFGTQTASLPADRLIAINAALAKSGFNQAFEKVEISLKVPSSWDVYDIPGTGVTPIGKRIIEAAVNPRNVANVRRSFEPNDVDIELGPDLRACTVALKFEDGTGTVVAALRDFVATVTAGDLPVPYVSTPGERISIYNVAYDPSSEVGKQDDRLIKLRSTAAAAFRDARFGLTVPPHKESAKPSFLVTKCDKASRLIQHLAFTLHMLLKKLHIGKNCVQCATS